jgi:hypothetical protein
MFRMAEYDARGDLYQAGGLQPPVDARAVAGLKFAECLPASLALAMLQHRASDRPAVDACLGETVRVVG